MSPSDGAITIHGEGATRLPPRAALGRPVPDALVLAEAENGPQRGRVHGVPRRRDAETPFGIDVAALVDDHVHRPGAADLGEPVVRGLRRRVGHGDAVDLRVCVRDGREGLEGLFRD